LIFVFLPRPTGDEFKIALAGRKAAEDTLALRGIPTSPEGLEARGAIESRLHEYERALALALKDILDGARVYQGGGNELAPGLREGVLQAAEAAMVRRYPQFATGDNPKWEKVAEQARKGDQGPLTALGYQGDAAQHPVCTAILSWIGSGKKGGEVRKRFMAPPYGWPQDTVDGALLALLAGGHLRATHNNAAVPSASLTGPTINNADFKAETVVIGVPQRIAVRKLLQDNGIQAKQGDEGATIPALLAKIKHLAALAGGAPPLPAPPDIAYLDQIAQATGNAQIQALYEARDRLAADRLAWQATADKAQVRLSGWQTLQKLLAAAQCIPGIEDVRTQAAAIETGRRLLDDPDPVPPLCDAAAGLLRKALAAARDIYAQTYNTQLAELTGSALWSKLGAAQQQKVLRENELTGVPDLKVGTEADLLASATAISLAEWRNRTDALTQRFTNARQAAQKLVAPDARTVTLPKGSFSTTEEAQAWLAQLDAIAQQIMEYLQNGATVVVQ
jgi:hypothetical protein